jgi:hypothetical protein
MKKNELHPELLNIDRMKSKPFTKKDFQEISAFIKSHKEKITSEIKKSENQKSVSLK